MDWFECNNKRIVKDVSVDEDLVSSLLKSSEKKSKFLKDVQVFNLESLNQSNG